MPYDLTIHEKTLRRDGLRRADFATHKDLLIPSKLEATLERASKVGETGFTSLKLKAGVFGGKNTYKVARFSDELVLRILAKGITRLTGVRQSSRLAIAKAMKCLLEEGVDCTIYKLDIASFYESINVQEILADLEADMGFSRSCLNILKTFFVQANSQGISGLPRGVALSATLAEYFVRKFDAQLNSNPDVFYYSRFVDDIFVITGPEESPEKFLRMLKSSLPAGLGFNSKKTKFFQFDEAILSKTAIPPVHASFDFLGYQFEIFQRQKSNDGVRRKLRLDISNSKTNKIKTKAISAFLQFTKDQSFADLFDRLKLLTGNYVIYDQARKVRRKAGIFYNYSLISEGESLSLLELDNFLRGFTLNSRGKLGTALQANLSKEQRRKILRLSFKRGFENRHFHHFRPKDLVRLLGCWKYA